MITFVPVDLRGYKPKLKANRYKIKRMFRYIRQTAKRRALKSALKKSAGRKVSAHNLGSARTMGVMTTFKSDADNNALKKLKKMAKDNKIEFKSLMYYPFDKLPDNVIPDPGKVLFSDKECNWFGKPTASEVQYFLGAELDMLIDLTSEECFVMHYIVVASKATFKIGRCAYDDNPYDFTIAPGSGTTDEEFVQTLSTYLSKFEQSE